MNYQTIKTILDLSKKGKRLKEVAQGLGLTIGTVNMVISPYNLLHQGKDVPYLSKSRKEMFVRYDEEQIADPSTDIVLPAIDPVDPFIKAEQKLQEAIIELADIYVKKEVEKVEGKYTKELEMVKAENKKLHTTLEAIQKQSIVGMLKQHFGGNV